MRELPPSLPLSFPPTMFFPLSLLQTSLVLPFPFSLTLSLSFLLFYITSIFLLQPSSSHCPRPSCLFPIPYVFLRLFSTIFFLFFSLSVSLVLSLSLFGCVSFRLIAIGHSRNARSGLSWVKG